MDGFCDAGLSAKHGVPYVTYAFAFMTFIGALKSRFRDVADVFKRPLPLILMLLILHVLGPVAACGLGHLLFPGNMNYITGMVLEFSVPAAVISLMWVSIYNGNSPLSLSLVVIDTILAPFLIPTVLKLLVGSSVKMDTVGMMKELVFMIALPAVLAMCLNEVSHGKVKETWPKKLAPFSKMCLISPYMKHLNGERLEVAAAILVLAAGGYAIGWIIAILTRQNKEATVSMIYGSGMRNISAGAVIAGAYFPAETLFPVMIGTLFQQILAAFYGSMMRRVQTGQQEREKEHGVSA